MKQQPLVSIIMIFLNEEQYIEEAIASVFAQTYNYWELLLVDDGSTDKSTKIAQFYAEKSSNKVRYLEHEGHQNLGMSATRNLGIQKAQGNYITFLDADDIWLPGKLEQQVAVLESQPEVALVCNPAQWWYSWTGNPAEMQRDFVQKLGVQLNTLVQPPALLIRYLQDECASLCDVLIRSEVVEAIGGYETLFRGMYEDQVFHAKICLQFPVFTSSQCWYKYRQHLQSCTAISHKEGQYAAARQAFLSWLGEYLAKHGSKNIEVERVLQKQLWRHRHPFLYRLLRRIKHLVSQVKRLVKPVEQQAELPIIPKL